jgi:hypothetical protein
MTHARGDRPDFAHPVEQELARLFDALSIRAPGAVVVRPPGIDILALTPGTLEGTLFPPQRVDGGLTMFGIEELVDV